MSTLKLTESALARPSNRVAYGEPDVTVLVAASGVGLAKNRAFVDGNQRAAFSRSGLAPRFEWPATQLPNRLESDPSISGKTVRSRPAQNKKYRCAIGSTVAGSQVSNTPSARTS